MGNLKNFIGQTTKINNALAFTVNNDNKKIFRKSWIMAGETDKFNRTIIR